MKKILKPFLIFILLFSLGIPGISAHPRVIKGTVYRDGKPASGVRVTAHKSSGSYFTSFDGKYELKASQKTRWIKFEFPDKEEKLDIDENSSDIMDFGEPSKNRAPGTTQPGKTALRTMSGLSGKINLK